MLDTVHPEVQIGAMDAATFAFGWVTNCMHQDGWMSCFMYFGTPSTPAASSEGGDAVAAPEGQGMIGSILSMIGVPSFIISLLAMVGLK